MPSMSFEDYYSLLGVSPASSAVEIRKAYRRLVLQFHPDRNPGDDAAEEQFKRIVVAYEILSNTAKRLEYDVEFQAARVVRNQSRAQTSRARTGSGAEEGTSVSPRRRLSRTKWSRETFDRELRRGLFFALFAGPSCYKRIRASAFRRLSFGR